MIFKRLKDAIKRLNMVTDRLEAQNERRAVPDILGESVQVQNVLQSIRNADMTDQELRRRIGLGCPECISVALQDRFSLTHAGLANAIHHLVIQHGFPLLSAITSVQEATWSWEGWDGKAPRPWYMDHIKEGA